MSQLTEAIRLIEEAAPAKIVTLGGECSVSVAPFAHLAAKYGDDLAIVWVDAHADCTLPDNAYDGYHAMALSHLIGKGDQDIVRALPATVNPSRVALAGVHAWTEWDLPNAREWGIQSFSANDLNKGTETLLTWLKSTGCSKVAVHLDLDVVDSNDIVIGLGMEPGGLSREALIRTITDLTTIAELVGVTVAEYVPRQVIAVREILNALPLPKIGNAAARGHRQEVAGQCRVFDSCCLFRPSVVRYSGMVSSVTPKVLTQVRPRVDYELSEVGRSLLEPLAQLRQFGPKTMCQASWRHVTNTTTTATQISWRITDICKAPQEIISGNSAAEKSSSGPWSVEPWFRRIRLVLGQLQPRGHGVGGY